MWQYEVTALGDPIEALGVEALFAPGQSGSMSVDDDASTYVRDIQYASGSGWVTAPASNAGWAVPCNAGCRVRYRFALREAALALNRVDTAIASGVVVAAPPATWLLRPDLAPGRFRFRVRTSPPALFAAATHPSPDAADVREAPTSALEGSGFAVFGRFEPRLVREGAASIDVAVAPAGLSLSADEVASWVQGAAHAIASYYGTFPVSRSLVVVIANAESGPTRGETLGEGGGAVLVRAGQAVTAATVRDDWVVTHELLHVTLPTLARQHAWLSEGIPSYVEPLARARVGQLAAEKVWADLVEGLPQGLPQSGDLGLDRTPTWGRTYWGGALFCLLADVTIRERTSNRRSLDDALRAVVAGGKGVEEEWPIERLLAVGDSATGTTVLHELYDRLALAPSSVDLPALWARLGVRTDGARVTFNEGAPLAFVRRAMTAPR